MPLPDIRGRELILKVHMRKVPLDDDVKPSVIARGTPGFSGADLANLVNEAALFAARANKRVVSMDEFEKAKDKIMMGTERRSMVMSEKEKLNTAYHEAGHAIVGYCVPDHDPCLQGDDHSARTGARRHDVSARRRQVQHLARRNRRAISRHLFGGRIAEEMTLGVGRHHDRGGERYRTRDRDRTQHGDQVGPVREARPADL